MSRRYLHAVALTAIVAFSAPGCRRKAAPPAPAPTPAPTPVPVDYAGLRVDELGHIPVVMYHDIGDAKAGKNNKMNRTAESFRKDLQYLYDNGFVPVNLRDVVRNQIEVPAGKSPVVLTFDDARLSQFKLNETASTLEVDPNCAVGILEAFAKEHPDWKPRATFFVLPKSKTTIETFRQAGLGAQKLKYLIDNGYEIGNHTTLHLSLGSMDAARIQQELGGAQKAIQALAPDVQMESFAAPFGVYPRNKKLWTLLQKGTYQGTEYHHTAVCQAAWRPMPAPGAKGYNPVRIERITPEDIRFGLHYWVDELVAGRMSRYISDGDPATVSFPRSEEGGVQIAVLQRQGKRINAYAMGGPGGGKPIVAGVSKPIAEPSGDPKPIAAPVSKPIVKP